MEFMNHLIIAATNLLLTASFCVLFFKLLKWQLKPDPDGSVNMFSSLIFLSGVLPFSIFIFSSSTVLATMFEIEMSREIDTSRFIEFIGIYTAVISCATLTVLACDMLIWKMLFSGGKNLKLHMDDRNLSTAVLIFGMSLAISLSLAATIVLFLSEFVLVPSTPLFR